MIIRYDSIAALRTDYIKRLKPSLRDEPWVAPRRSRSRYENGDSWYNGETEAQSLRLAAQGDTKLVPEAERLLSDLDTHIETPRRVWNRSPAGAYCVVPEYLAGIPTCMRRLDHEQDEQAPITVLVATTCSAGVDSKTLEKRGTVILALVMALSRVRPVTLQALTLTDGDDEGETIFTASINTSPLDLATACYVMTSAGFARRLTYNLARSHNNFSGGWPRNFRYGRPELYYEYLKQRLTPDPDKCLVIGAAQYGDELLASPLTWIEKQITRFTQASPEEDSLT